MTKQPYILLILLTLSLLILIGCASTQYTEFEGGKVKEGSGGAKKVVDGVDIWTRGTPPRKYQIIGVVNDWSSAAASGGVFKRLAKQVKAKGGDAAITMGSQAVYQGSYTTGNATASSYGNSAYASGYSNTYDTYSYDSEYAVIKYVK